MTITTSFDAGIKAGHDENRKFACPTEAVDFAKALAAERGFEPDDFACGFVNEFYGWVA